MSRNNFQNGKHTNKIAFKYTDEVIAGTTKPTLQTKANVGDASIWAEAILREKQPEAVAEVRNFFKGLDTINDERDIISRSKSALSIETKMMRGLKKQGAFNSMDDALLHINDGIGSRVFTPTLERLSKADIDKMITNMTYEGEKLTPRQAKMLKNYIYSKDPSKCCNEAFRLYEAFAQPLIEKRSKEVVDRLTLGILKYRKLNEGLDIKDLQARGLFDEDFLNQRMTAPNFSPRASRTFATISSACSSVRVWSSERMVSEKATDFMPPAMRPPV